MWSAPPTTGSGHGPPRGSTAPSAGAPAGAGPPRSCSNPAETRSLGAPVSPGVAAAANSVTSSTVLQAMVGAPHAHQPQGGHRHGQPQARPGRVGHAGALPLPGRGIQAAIPGRLLAAGGKSVISNRPARVPPCRVHASGPCPAGALPARARRGGEADNGRQRARRGRNSPDGPVAGVPPQVDNGPMTPRSARTMPSWSPAVRLQQAQPLDFRPR